MEVSERQLQLVLSYFTVQNKVMSLSVFDQTMVHTFAWGGHPGIILNALIDGGYLTITKNESGTKTEYRVSDKGREYASPTLHWIQNLFSKINAIVETLGVTGIDVRPPFYSFSSSGRKFVVAVRADQRGFFLRLQLPTDLTDGVAFREIAMTDFDRAPGILKDLWVEQFRKLSIA